VKDQKFALVMTAEDKRQLDDLARQERISQAAVLRRLIWAASQQHQVTTGCAARSTAGS